MRALLLSLDGLGVGSTPDADCFNDQGADTLGHIRSSVRDLELPTLFSLGLGEIMKGCVFDPPARKCAASYGRMRPCSPGKDSTSGHWELAGAIIKEPFASFEEFPEGLVATITKEAKVEFLGNCLRDSAAAFEEFGEEHLCTGRPILYASPGSVMQIAVHEAVVPLGRLYQICRIARRHCDEWRVGRVIARPFAGSCGAWKEASGRHDYTVVPPRTILNAISEAGFPVEGVGKISDLFARSGVTRSHPATSNLEALKIIREIWRSPENGMIFANLAEFDTLFGHRRDPSGFARALENFDDWLADFLEEIESDDLLILTGDHGNDPTFGGTDHTREEVPVIVRYDGRTGPLGIRETFADVAATLGAFFDIGREEQTRWHTGTPLITFHRTRASPLPR